jgi:hypothetical protein
MAQDAVTENGPPADAQAPTEEPWRVDGQGRSYVPARGRSGLVYRQGNETLQEALARDAKGPQDRKPKKKAKKAPPAPTQTSLKELEFALAEGLSAPAMIAAGYGDEWGANHFTVQGPKLARNLVKASEHNPWLRAKLEAAMLGEDYMIMLITTMGVAGAVFGYAIPPLIYYLNPSFVSEKTREMFDIPPREDTSPQEAADAAAAPPQAPETPLSAAA